MSKPKVGILTTFAGADEAYSLVVVVKTQLRMLLDAGYDPVLFVSDQFVSEDRFWSGRLFEVRKVAHPDAKAADIQQSLAGMIGDINVMLCHDILFLSQHREWGDAVRALAAELDVAWLHWQHSRGDGQSESCARSWYCYPNEGDLPHCAAVNHASLNRTRYVPHPLDFDYLGWPALAVRIAEDYGFPFADVSCILPTRLDRQKQVDKAVRLMAGFKRAGRSVRFLVADAYCTGEPFLSEKKRLNELAREQGLDEQEFAFLGECYDECRVTTPRPVVKALYEMSNLFVQPSNSETSSLVAMEAALAGCLLVLNADFPPILPLYKKALALPFGSVLNDTKYYRTIRTADGQETKVEDAQLFWDDQARLTVLPALDSQIVGQVKRQQLAERWPRRVWEQRIEPLILEAWDEVRPQ
jgi:glycosyltransferase involved in cell wall biosynthesis